MTNAGLTRHPRDIGSATECWAGLRFKTPGFSIDAELPGTAHEFVFEGATVRVRLPEAIEAGEHTSLEAPLMLVQWIGGVPATYDVDRVRIDLTPPNQEHLRQLLVSSAG